MANDVADAAFGCEACYGASAEAFWDRYPGFESIAYLIDDPHDIVRIVSCPSCAQRYVCVTTEFVDWQDGEDPIYRSIVPLTVDESERMRAQGANVDLRWIESLGSGRRHLCTSWPKGKDQSVYWSEGIVRILPGG
jgi:hypothetical protein